MPKNWKIYKLEEVAQLRKEGIKPSDFNGEDYIGLEHIGQGDFLLDGIGKASDVKSNKSKFVEGDILYGKIRPYFKKVYRPKFSGICSTDILIINTKNENLVSQSYLHHLIKTQEFTDKATETSSGTKMPRADWKSLEKWGISFPPLPEQTQIANILSAIDDKIENNLAINKTLEDMAMALYKHWFVDFGPFQDGEFIDSELGLIPKGWEVKRLEELSEIGSSKRIFRKEYVDEGIPFYRSKEVIQLSKGNNISTELFIIAERFQEIKIKFGSPKKGDILISSVGTIGVSWLVDDSDDFYFKDGNLTWLKKYKSYIKGEFLHLWLNSNIGQEQILGETIGSTQKALTISALRSLKLVVPPKSIYQKVELDIINSYSQIQLNQSEVQTLTKLRDTLLPKLISGEVRLKEFREGIDAEINSA